MTGEELARALDVLPSELEKMAVSAQLQINYSQLCGL
jgi:hypothetical protein